MKHARRVKKLSRPLGHRKAMLSNLVASLIRYEKIKTTRSKAKATKQLLERILKLAKGAKGDSRRKVGSVLRDKIAVEKLFEVFVPKFEEKDSGFVKVYKIGKRRGDNSEMVMLKMEGTEVKSPSTRSGQVISKSKSKSKREEVRGDKKEVKDKKRKGAERSTKVGVLDRLKDIGQRVRQPGREVEEREDRAGVDRAERGKAKARSGI